MRTAACVRGHRMLALRLVRQWVFQFPVAANMPPREHAEDACDLILLGTVSEGAWEGMVREQEETQGSLLSTNKRSKL